MERLMLSPEEVAEALGIGRSTVYDMLRMNALKSVLIGRRRRIRVVDLRDYVDALGERSSADE